MKIAFIIDPLNTLNPKKDSTLAMIEEACVRNWQVFTIEAANLYIDNAIAYAKASLYGKNEIKDIALTDLDVIMMRREPPFDMDYIYATYILELAQASGVKVYNNPQSLRDANEKMFINWFSNCIAPTIVTADKNRIAQFLSKHHDIIIKPLDGMGGASIFRIKNNDYNFGVICETLTNHGKKYAMVQKYLPAVKEGDKRILLINGKPVPYALARIAKKGETRSNIHAGGTARGQALSARDKWLCEQIGPTLKAKGLMFVGIDVIGDYITEINVTCPTCIRELDAAFDINIAGMLLDELLEKI